MDYEYHHLIKRLIQNLTIPSEKMSFLFVLFLDKKGTLGDNKSK